jgi:preprotein translocase subunit SecF
MEELQELKNEIEKIKERNARVEADKAWETSFSRKVLIAVLTYIVIVLFFLVADLQRPFVSAIIPTIGFILSTLSIPFFKKIWVERKK